MSRLPADPVVDRRPGRYWFSQYGSKAGSSLFPCAGLCRPNYRTPKNVTKRLEQPPHPRSQPPARNHLCPLSGGVVGSVPGSGPMELKHQLTPHLKHLRLSGILETLDARHRQAVDGKWSYIEFLERLLQDEVERRGQKQLTLRLRRATLATTKTRKLRFQFQSHPQPATVTGPGTGITSRKNACVLAARPGRQSHLASSLRSEACRLGFESCLSTLKLPSICTVAGPITLGPPPPTFLK